MELTEGEKVEDRIPSVSFLFFFFFLLVRYNDTQSSNTCLLSGVWEGGGNQKIFCLHCCNWGRREGRRSRDGFEKESRGRMEGERSASGRDRNTRSLE